MVDLTIALDTRQFDAWASQTVKQMTRQLRSAVDKSARYARAQTISVLARDSGVAVARFRKAVPPVRGSSGADLSAKWIISKSPNFIRGPGGTVLAPVRGEGVEASTFSLSGGGSAALSLPKAFAINVNGGRAVFIRTGKGRAAIRAVYAEMPNTAMAQPDSAPRKAWEEAGERSLSLLTVAAVQAALDGQASEPSVPGIMKSDPT